MDIGNRIKELREGKKWSQEELAAKMGITQDSISLWEKNRRTPNTQYVIALCNLFEISSDYLLGIENEEGIKKYSYPQTHASVDEQELLRAYRQMSEGKKRALFQMLDIDLTALSKKNTN